MMNALCKVAIAQIIQTCFNYMRFEVRLLWMLLLQQRRRPSSVCFIYIVHQFPFILRDPICTFHTRWKNFFWCCNVFLRLIGGACLLQFFTLWTVALLMKINYGKKDLGHADIFSRVRLWISEDVFHSMCFYLCEGSVAFVVTNFARQWNTLLGCWSLW